MSFFHLRPTGGNIWPPLLPAPLARCWAAYQELDRTQWLRPDEIEQLQLAQVRTLLAHCLQHVPYYQRTLTAAGIVPAEVRSIDDFRRIPLLQRRTYQEQYPDFCARSLPPGMTEVGTLSTSGTSGVAIEVRQTDLVHLWWFAFHLRDLEWSDTDPRGTLAAIRATFKSGPELQPYLEGARLPSWGPQLAALIENGPSYLMDHRQDPRAQLRWLRRVAPDYLLSYPANLELLAEVVKEEGEAIPGLRLIKSFGEALPADARVQVESAFGVSVKDTYSCSEADYLASPCPEGHGLHVHAENVLVEVLDETGGPCGPGQTGRVVLTTLHNFAGPFIRYEIEDEATLAARPCPCGRGLPLWSAVLGRRLPLFRLPDGRRKSTRLLMQALRELGGHRPHRIVQRALDHVAVRLVPGRGWTADHPDRTRRMIEEFFEAPVRVDIEIDDHLELPP